MSNVESQTVIEKWLRGFSDNIFPLVHEDEITFKCRNDLFEEI